MADTLPTQNKRIQILDSSLVKVIKDAVPAAEQAILANWPWLKVPVVRQLWEGLLNWIVDQIANAAGTLTGYVVLDSEKYERLKEAAAALEKLNEAKAQGDVQSIAQTSSELDSKVDPILHYVGDVTPS